LLKHAVVPTDAIPSLLPSPQPLVVHAFVALNDIQFTISLYTLP